MKKIILVAISVLLATPIYAGTIENLSASNQINKANSLQSLSLKSKFSSQDNNNIALSTLYNRLFQLQDKKGEFELKRYKQNKALKNIFLKFREKNRSYSKYSDKELLEIANDPKHMHYPGITNSSAIKGMNEIKLAGEEIEYSDFELERINDNIEDTKQMINKFLNYQNPSKK